ncbi:Pyr_redox_2 domain-containing protein [Caenorhabditis elegans]|uniref:Pyr_redox_2 domain-containing protein n=2 Tax=Caenorhabditis elegans TaxID=6239 RepID=Q9U229_CAEEL|nr:Pyr_redox_2 domain-containing protein [Caenorhabditis elegans]CAB60511.2 Pyr_redox_2 domain-containing protein [Caenorhabditis elegans]|eukprot:NP_499564.2 Worm AIF (apoptosis inducing factor) Homolog [Caenorhabditis elegans]
MLLRAVGRQMTSVIFRQQTAVRSIAMSRVALGGGGHHHEPTPVYIPKPGSLDWTFFSRSHTKSAHEFEPYKPEIGAFIGAVAFIGLTLIAVVIKTDVFKKEDSHGHGHGHAKHSKKHEEKHEQKHEEKEHAEPEKKEEAKPEKPAEPKEPEPAQKQAEQPEQAEEKQETKDAEPKEQVDDRQTEEAVHARRAPAAAEEPAPSTSKADAVEEKRSEQQSMKPSESTEENTTTTSADGLLHCEYVIIGSGTAAYYASLSIRAKQAEAKVLMIGEEPELPYNRPPLSKELWWYGDETSATKLAYTPLSGKKRDIFYEVDGFFVSPEDLPKAVHGGVALLRGRKAVKICEEDKKVILEDGTTIGYDKLLIATGVRPKKEQVFEEASEEAKQKITYFHYPADFKRVERGLADKSVQKVTIIGNGLLASELSYSIKRKYGENVEVHQVFEEKYPAEDILPEHIAQKSIEAIRKGGVDVRAEQKVEGVRKCCKNVVLKLSDGSELRTDLVVVATGEEPNSEIIEASGLKIDEKLGGVRADKCLKVGENVWAAGAIATFEDGVLGARRVSSWENAQISGRLAGENMATAAADGKSEGKAFWYQPSFFTKFAPHLHINAIGKCDSSLETVSVHAEPDKDTPLEKAVVFYKSKEDGSIVGVLLLNVFGPSLDVARRIIDDRKKVDEYKEIAKLFPLYDPVKSDEDDAKSA